MDFNIDKANNKVLVKKEFAASPAFLWAAWTESRLLDQWWAPKPWKAGTKTMDFSEGGSWIYAMTSPEGEEHWSRNDYLKIGFAEKVSKPVYEIYFTFRMVIVPLTRF
ncbi:MAG TPA: SRPBCC domain-containing protein [Bacteroidales bacterium]|nr:SRPBCC domain-containing protein [Bacteroidales bacterium]